MVQLNKILKSFTRTLDQLEQLIAENHRTAALHGEQIDALQERQGILLSEAEKARSVSNKIKELISA